MVFRVVFSAAAKNLIPLVTIFIATAVCSDVLVDHLLERYGIYYEVDSQKTFTGSAVDYYENGSVKTREVFKDGRRHGYSDSYYENGRLWMRFNYQNGKQHGFAASYYKNGKLGYKGNYTDGKEDECSEYYNSKGEFSYYEGSPDVICPLDWELVMSEEINETT